jgi:hypothetical protein
MFLPCDTCGETDGACTHGPMRQRSPVYRCRWHLPGNVACPMPALYQLHWQDGPDRNPLRRDVCVAHLVAALDEAIGRAPVVDGARVNFIDLVEQ